MCEKVSMSYTRHTPFRTYSTCRVKLNSLLRVNVTSLLLCIVPSVLCSSDSSRLLTFDEIYNTTSYAQLQHTARPYQSQNASYNFNYNQPSFNIDSHRYNIEDIKGNELEYEDNIPRKESREEQLLIGLSHDPFRYSVPKEDYLKGVRDMTASTIMSKSENRGKRGVLELYNMMYCATGCEPLAYKGYGCYCGFLGSGEPTDGIDRCCMIHDRCYDNIFCPFFTVYLQPYLWKCYKGRPLCAAENYRNEGRFIGGCAAQLCECDRKFAMCVKKYACPRKRSLCYSSPLRFLQNIISIGR